MKKSKLIVGILFASISATALLGGCGGNSSAPQKAAETAKAVESAPAAATATATPEAAATNAPAQDASIAQVADASAATNNAAAGANTAAAGSVTLEKAQETALADAGFTAADVVIKKAAQDVDDGVTKFEIDFYVSDTEYEYDIDAGTGAILSKKTEAMDAEDYTEMNALQGIDTTVKSADAGMTEDKALEIALQHANVARDSISQVQTHQEFDDDYGKNVYDVEFHVGANEYSYDIDAETGDILSYEQEVDD
ncbi:MAG: PepSY domain-containing protein [Lachnospiraceae bacterium]|nr:PepSY domain-containing protein [Lachnospiraceae bacterium]